MAENLSVEQFVLKAIERLRTKEYKGIHTVYSGFNEAFKKYFPNLNPVKETSRLAEEGKIVIRPSKGGVILYKPEEAPINVGGKAQDVLKKMGIE